MKAIQVTVDERLLRRLDDDPECRRVGRSAVVRHALTEYFKRRRRSSIGDAYQRGYNKHPISDELEGWSDEAAWPNK